MSQMQNLLDVTDVYLWIHIIPILWEIKETKYCFYMMSLDLWNRLALGVPWSPKLPTFWKKLETELSSIALGCFNEYVSYFYFQLLCFVCYCELLSFFYDWGRLQIQLINKVNPCYLTTNAPHILSKYLYVISHFY